MITYAGAAAAIARTAVIAVDLGNYTRENAINFAASKFVETAADARARRGAYARETTTETLEEVYFYAAVARDVLDGEASVPSIGNVRQAALNELDKLF